jgi:hypothetical protein
MTKTTPAPITPTHQINLTSILSLYEPVSAALTAARQRPADVRLARRDPVAPAASSLMRSLPKRPATMQPVGSRTLSVPRVKGWMSRAAGTTRLKTLGVADIKLPPGISRFVNAATLKVMLRANRSDVLLRKSGDDWEIYPDSAKIDLADTSVEFRLGRIQIYS